MNKTRLQEKFIHQWVEVYVSAIVEYGTTSTKKALRTLMKELAIYKEGKISNCLLTAVTSFIAIDDVAMQLAAMKVLATALGKGENSGNINYSNITVTWMQWKPFFKIPAYVPAAQDDLPSEESDASEQYSDFKAEESDIEVYKV